MVSFSPLNIPFCWFYNDDAHVWVNEQEGGENPQMLSNVQLLSFFLSFFDIVCLHVGRLVGLSAGLRKNEFLVEGWNKGHERGHSI